MSAAVQKMGTKGQVTLPKHVREALGLKPGDLLETVLTRRGALTRPVELKPRKLDDLEEALAQAEADMKAGRVSKPYRSAHALVRDSLAAGKRRRARAGTKN
jgi:AbrB family looped-hinge helix DNA binding protein